MPETDQDIHDFNEEEKSWRTELNSKYASCIKIITEEDFLKEDGWKLLKALAEYRQVAVVPPTPREMRPEEGAGLSFGIGSSEQESSPKSSSRMTFALAGGILGGVAIIGLVFLAIYKLLSVGAAVVGIFGALLIFTVSQNPGLLLFLNSKLASEASNYSQVVDSIFEEIIKDLKQAIYVPRVVPPQFTDKTKQGAFHDELYRDPVTQAIWEAGSEWTNKLGVIQSAAERELYRRRRLLIKVTGEVSGAAASQSIRPQTKS